MHNTVVQYIATQSLMDLCKVVERKQGARVGMRWWEQEGVYLTGARDTAAIAAEEDKDGMED